MGTEKTKQSVLRTARVLAPEDIRPGMYVCLMYWVDDILPYGSMMELRAGQPVELLYAQFLPCGRSDPMKVIDVCLPFVLVKQLDGEHDVADVRRHRLARVTARFGRAALRLVKAQQKKKGKSDDDDDD